MNAQSTSQLNKRLAEDETLAKACDEFAQRIRDSAREDAEVVANSERLTREDLSIVINARAEDLPAEPE